MKFDFIIGNPPYQEEKEGTSDKPIYDVFMDATFPIAEKVELITPGRFLFNAGKTPKSWNEKMLSDPHFKVLDYEQDSSKIFPNTSVMGGIVISYHDKTREYKPIGTFTNFDELNKIMEQVTTRKDFRSLSRLVYAPESYKFTELIHLDNPWLREKLSKGHPLDITSNIFDKVPELFSNEKISDDYIGLVGLSSHKRVTKWINRKYVKSHDNLDFYKVFLPKSNGSGAIGETVPTPLIGQPLIGQPQIGHTQSFISIGKFETEEEAEALLKYIKSKFTRALLGILKITQDNKKSVWKYVPMQNFTADSDIDWSKSVSEIDQQLYAKYNLTEDEIAFIESHIKEMK